MKLRQHQNAIAVLVACGLFLAVAVQFFFASPILEGLDVPAHYQYVLTLERGRHFPDPHASDVVRTSAHESVEYPLYYLIGAAITWRVPTGDLDQIAIPNPHFLDPRLGANRNAFFHRPFDGIPSGAELSARILELLSLSLGMVSVGSTVLLARALFPKRPTVWLSSGLLLVCLPAFDFLFVSVTNDTLVIALSTIVCLLLVLWVKHGRTRFGLLAAVALTGAVLTKANAFGLVVPYSVAVFNTQDSLAKRARFLGCLVGLILLVDGWWLIHMLATFGDLTGVSWLKQRFPEGPGPLFSVPLGVSLSNAVHEIPHLLSTIFINFNTDSEWSRLVPESALFVGLAAGCFSVREWLREPGTRQLAAPLIAWLLTMALEVAYWLTMYDAPGRLIYPAMAPVVVCAAAGWQWLWDRLRIGGDTCPWHRRADCRLDCLAGDSSHVSLSRASPRASELGRSRQRNVR